MKDQDPNLPNGSPVNSKDTENQTTQPKRKFVEPEISQPVDVLEATTFFQSVDSGGTN